MDYLNFKRINDYLRSIRKNSDLMLVRVESFNQKTNNCVIDFRYNKQNYPLTYIINGVINGLFCLSNPSMFASLDFDSFVIDNKSKNGVSLKSLKKRHSGTFYYKDKSINLCYNSDTVLSKPDLSEINGDGDFGSGLYCYYEKDIKKSSSVGGKYISKFTLNTDKLKILDIRDLSFEQVVALYLVHKKFIDSLESGIFIRKFGINLYDYDCIYGFILDEFTINSIHEFVNGIENDSYLRYIFCNNLLDMKFVLLSKNASESLTFNGYVRNKYTNRPVNYCLKKLNSNKYIKDYINETRAVK